MDKYGLLLALLGATLSALIPGIASARAVGMGGQAGAGVIAENPNIFGKVLILQLLPGTQGIYGLLISFITLMNIGVIGETAEVSLVKGLAFFAASMPIIIVGYFSAIYQAKSSVSSIALLAKRPDQFGKAMLFPAMVETYAILALLISMLAINGVAGLNI